MRNKGFFWFITIILTAVCLYQLSFTWVASSVENQADKEADGRVQMLKKEAATTGDSALLPNGQYVHFDQPEGEDLAKSAFINQILSKKADKTVYSLFGSTFAETKKRSLAFGLDLVGGMSVTLEISIPELIQNYARNPRDLQFKRPFDAAMRKYKTRGGDFISLFIDENKKINKFPVVRLLGTTEIEGLNAKSSDDDVESFLRQIVASSIKGVEKIMKKRIDQFGVAQPNIQKDLVNNRLYIELPGVRDEVTVAKKLRSTANLQFFETYMPSEIQSYWQEATMISRTEEVIMGEVDPADSVAVAAADSVRKAKEESLSSLGTSGKGLADYFKQVGDYAIGYVPVDPNAEIDQKELVDKILARADVMAAFPEDLRFMWGAEPESVSDKKKDKGYFLYAVKIPENGKANVGGKDVKNATTGYDDQNGKVTVDLSMNDEGADKWAEMTGNNVNRIVAITMDNVVYSAPRVINAITGGNTQISGSFTIDEAEDLAGLLNGGALPAPCVIKEQTIVGPTIGDENTKAGLISFGIALLVVFAYMFFYYGKAGLVADIALLANMIFIFGTLAAFHAVLTLAGIAGIVLTIGMAVDANVLVFERIREEIAAGKDQATAIDEGYKMALSSIIDANLTTLLTALVLKFSGSGGPIESFATTLIIGIFTSVFAALVISRLVFIWMMKKKMTINFDTKITKGAFKKININFVANRKFYYLISGALVLISIVVLGFRGMNSSVEFSGGRTFGVRFEKSAKSEIEYIRENISKTMPGASVDIKTKKDNYFVEITTNYKLSDESANEEVKAKLGEALKASKEKLGGFDIEESRSVSPTISKELIKHSSIAIILSLIMMFAYILLRFGSWQYSSGAILALAHDVIIVIGIFAAFHGILPINMDLDQAFIAAILTVIGYSINDTVIVFDRIRENLSWKKDVKQSDEINGALNSTLSRTINTSFTTFVVLLVIFLFGGAAIKGFVFALMIGVVVGTYSSLCIATPLLIDLTKKIKA